MPKHRAFGKAIHELEVVVIDDRPKFHALIKVILRQVGIQYGRFFTDAERALESMEATPPHLLITNWRMQPLDGCSLIKIMRHVSMPKLNLVPAFVLSGDCKRNSVESAFRAGAQNFLLIPVSQNVLKRSIAHLLRDEREFVLEDDYCVIEGMNGSLMQSAAQDSARSHMNPELIDMAGPSLEMPQPSFAERLQSMERS